MNVTIIATKTESRCRGRGAALVVISPPEFVRYLEELPEGLAAVGTSEEAAMELRRTLSEKHDIEVVGPPRQAGD